MLRIAISILTMLQLIGIGCSAGQRTNGEVRSSFKEAVQINERQRALLRQGAASLEDRTRGVMTMVASMEGPTGEGRSLVISSFDQELAELKKTEDEFVRLATTPEAVAASRVFFGDLKSRYIEAGQAWKGFEGNGTKPTVALMRSDDFFATRDDTTALTRDQHSAYTLLAETGSETFDLTVKSFPKEAAISYRRKGDAYTNNPDPTNTEIKNLVYAVWYVHAHLDGYEDDEKPHNPFREKNHQVDFELKRK
jgi:hypothetical protein